MRFLDGSMIGTKQELVAELLELGMVMLHLDARHDDATVPGSHSADPHLRLNFSYAFGLDDFVVGEDALSATLSFGGKGFHCIVGWEAVFAVTSHVEPLGYIWPASLPAELAAELAYLGEREEEQDDDAELAEAAELDAVEDTPEASPLRARPVLSLVKPEDDNPSDAEESDSEQEEDDSTDKPPLSEAPLPTDEAREGRRYGHLRVVK